MEVKQTYKPAVPVNIGIDKDTVNDFARKYNMEIEQVYNILNRYKQRKVVFSANGDYWTKVENGVTLSIPHNGNIVYCVYRIEDNAERQVVAGIKRTDTNIILESVAPFDGYMLFLSDDITRGVGGNLPDDVIPTMQEISVRAETAINTVGAIRDEVARMAVEKVGFLTPQMYGAVGDGEHDDKDSINTAIYHASLNGCDLVFSKGRYKISGSINLRDNVKLVGYGAVIVGDTTLSGDRQYFNAMSVNDKQNVSIDGFEFVDVNNCIDIRNSKNVTLSNLYGHDTHTVPDDTEPGKGNYMIVVIDSSRVNINNIRWENPHRNGDCLRLKCYSGNVSYVNARNMNGYCGDVFLALCTDEDLDEMASDDDAAGHVIHDCTFDNVYTENGNYSGLGIEVRRAKSSLNNIRFTNCNFVADKTLFTSGKDRGQAPVCMATTTNGFPLDGVTRSGVLDNVIFEGCVCEIGTHSDGDRPAVRVAGLTVRNCAFENCVFLNRINSLKTLSGIEFRDACTVFYSRIDGFVCKNPTTTKFNGVSFSADTITRGVSLTDCAFEGSNSANPIDTYFVDIKSKIGTGRTNNVNISLNGCKCQNATALVNADTAAGTITINNYLRSTIPAIVNASSSLKVNDNTQDITDIKEVISVIPGIVSSNLNIITCGDSIAYGATDETDGTRQVSYAEQISSSVRNVAVSGAWLADNAADTTKKAIWYQLASSALSGFTPDVILMEGGVNDFTSAVHIGNVPTEPTEPTATERQTIIGGLRKLFYEAQTRYPNAKKYFVSTHKIKIGDSYLPTKSYRDGVYNLLVERIKQTCEVYSIEFIDVYGKSPLNTYFGKHATDYTILKNGEHDGLHPTTAGYAFGYVPVIKRALGFSKE